jgi:hypothetical protein
LVVPSRSIIPRVATRSPIIARSEIPENFIATPPLCQRLGRIFYSKPTHLS